MTPTEIINDIKCANMALDEYCVPPKRVLIMSVASAQKVIEHYLEMSCKITDLCPDDRFFITDEENYKRNGDVLWTTHI